MTRHAISAFVCLLFVGAGAAQLESATGTPWDTSLDSSEGVVISLALPAEAIAEFPVTVPIANRDVTVMLTLVSLRAPGYVLELANADGSREAVPPGPDVTYRGAVPSDSGASAAGALLDEGLYLRIRLASGEEWWLEPLDPLTTRGEITNHRLFRVRSGSSSASGGTADGPSQDGIATRGGCAPACIADVVCDTDWGFVAHHGGTAIGAQNAILSVINTVNLQFASEVGIRHRVTHIVIRTATSDPYDFQDPNAVLCQFINEWETNHTGVPRDLAILFGYEFVGQLVRGQAAAIGSVCVPGTTCNPAPIAGAYCFVNEYAALSGFPRWLAHQLGHLWGASDCDCPGTTMNPSGSGTTFVGAGSNSVAEITTYRDSLTCLDSVSPVNDDCGAAIAITSSGLNFGSNIGATTDGTSSCGGVADVWWVVTPPLRGMMLIDTCGSSIPTTVSVHSSCPPGQSQLDCASGCSMCENVECVDEWVSAGFPYYIRVASSTGETGDIVLRVQLPCSGLTRPGLTATDGTNCDAVRITWNPVVGATGYRIFRQEGFSAAVLIGAPTTSPFEDVTAVPGVVYGYWGISVGECGTSTYSSTNLESGFRGPPAAPASVSATTAICDRIRVSWTSVVGATAYEVWRATTSDIAEATLLDVDSASPYDDMAAAPETDYYYWVRAVHDCGPTAFGGWSRGYHGAPRPPESVSASDGIYCDRVFLSYFSSGATSYSIWRAEMDDPTQAAVVGTGSFFQDTSVVPGVLYYYWVTASNSCGVSPLSDSDVGFARGPTAPTGVAATNGSQCSYVGVTWYSVPTATQYHVFRSVTDNVATAIQIASRTTTSLDDSTATPGTFYYYWVRATNTCWTSDFSSPPARGFTGPPPLPPTGLSASDGSSCQYVLLTWLAAEGATQYDVRRATVDSFSSSSVVATRSIPSHTDSSATPGVTYYYWVVSRNNCGAGPASGSDSGFREAPPPPPASVSASVGACDGVTLSWSPVSGATSYEVWYGTNSNSSFASRLTTVTGSPYNHTSAVPGVTYYYWVRSIGTCGLGAFGNSVTGSRGGAPPAPTNVAASNQMNCSPIRITWNASPGATSYEIWRNDVPSPIGGVLLGTDNASPFDDNSGLAEGWYFVRAVNDCGFSAFGGGDYGSRVGLPPPPPWVSATDGICPFVAITWGSIGPATYQVWRGESTEFANASLVGSTPLFVTHFEDDSAIAGVTYYYWVRAVGSCGAGSPAGPDAGHRHCDCNANGIEDDADIASGTSGDCDSDSIPDECACPQDITRDALVDLADLATLLVHFGESGTDCVDGDINRDGAVDLVDLATLLTNFGLTCN